VIHSHPHVAQPPPASGFSPRRRLALTFALVSIFMVVEAVGGIISGSLALLADAGHMLTDAGALALSYFAIWLAGREASLQRTYGFRRAEILAAFVNAVGLVLLAIWILVEAVERLNAPRPVASGIMLTVAAAGLAVNVVGWWLLHPHAKDNLTIRSALWHIMGDLLGSAGAIAAALVIRFTGWTAIDPLIGIAIAVLIGVGGARILHDSTHLLLDSVPRHIDSLEVRRFLDGYPEVSQICDLHIWGISSTETMLTAHLVVEETVDRDAFLHTLSDELKARFALAHMTLQLEGAPGASCEPEW
jgi:cobalt-zinc-cadmium efflux system protein